MNILSLLSRADKHFLGGGNRVVWTPPFPVWLDKLGFWDKASYFNFDFEPVFTVTILDEKGRELRPKFLKRDWNPARLKQVYHLPRKLHLTEEKAVLPEDSLISRFTFENAGEKPQTLHLILWTAQESDPYKGKLFVDNADIIESTIRFTKFIRLRDLPLHSIHAAMGFSLGPDSYAIQFSERTANQPLWKLTPFFEKFREAALPNTIHLSGINQSGLIYMALHRKIRVNPGAKETLFFAATLTETDEETAAHLQKTLKSKNPIGRSRENWERFFESVPYFESSDPYFTRAYWYRWYGLRLFMLQGGDENYPFPAVCEGPTYFRVPITYSAQCHMLETRWLPRPDVAQGSLLNFIYHQNDDGSFSGHIYPNGKQTSGFYHANWGWSSWEVLKIHPDRQFLERAYIALSRYADYFDLNRDQEDSGLYDVLDQFETGQEFMSRYLAVDPKADTYDWSNNIRLKGVDATVYMYQLKKYLSQMATELGLSDEAKDWQAGAEKIKEAVRALMWDASLEMFFDVNPQTMKPTGVKAAVCFYPYLTDIVDESYLPGLKKHLLNPEEFWTPWPVPSTSVDDPLFNPEAEWKGKRHNCPWNGRVWPMTNSHIAEVLAQTALRFHDPELEKAAVDFIRKFVRLLFFDQDVNRPNCFEHYNPFTGTPSVYRGIDDYQHSWLVDLIIKYVVGVQVDDSRTVTLRPFDFGLKYFVLENLHIAGDVFQIKGKGSKARLEKIEATATNRPPIE